MSKREKIILGLMGAAILFGLIKLLSSGEKTAATAQTQDTQAATEMIAGIINSLPKENVLRSDLYIMEKAAEDWTRQPFIRPEWLAQAKQVEAESKESETAESAGCFRYTGFLGSALRRLAIINGKEYEIGDPIEATGFKLLTIAPGYVEIGGPDGENRMIELEETTHAPAGE